MTTLYFLVLILLTHLTFESCSDSGESRQTFYGGFQVEVLAENLEVPWGLDYLPDGTLIYSERNGTISLLTRKNQIEVVHERPVTDRAEGGLLGLVVDPEFNQNNYVYIYETVEDANQVVRLTLQYNKVSEEHVIIDGIPKARFHNGGILRFGPDGYLYIGTGDSRTPMLAQDTLSLAGKILRVDQNGDPVPGNPFNSRIWSYGHRNVQGMDWNVEGEMLATEHGPSGEINGWCCHDEINLIVPGGNYGWPFVIGDDAYPGTILPLAHSGKETWAPGGGIFVNGKEWGDWENSFLVAGLRGARMIRFEYNNGQIQNQSNHFVKEYQRLRNIIQNPDGSIIFCSSNKDGRAIAPLKKDDKIYRLIHK